MTLTIITVDKSAGEGSMTLEFDLNVSWHSLADENSSTTTIKRNNENHPRYPIPVRCSPNSKYASHYPPF